MAEQKTIAGTDNRRAPFIWISKDFFKIGADPYAIAAYCALLYYTISQRRQCEHISIRTLARIAAMSERKMQLALASLEKKGAIRVRHRSQKSGSGKRIPLPNLYEILNLDPNGSLLI